MARKRPSKTSAGTKAASTRAKKNAAKKIARKAASAGEKARSAGSAKAATAKARTAKGARSVTKAAPAARKARAAKAARKAGKAAATSKPATKRSAARKAVVKKTAAATAAKRKSANKTSASRASAIAGGARKTSKPAKKAGARAPDRKSPAPAPRRSAPRISAGRRASARKVASREALAKKTLVKPVAAPRKPAKKRPAKQAPSTKASGKTARSRLVARKSQKLAPPVLRDTARRPVVKPTAPRPETAAKPARTAPFRLHALGVREEHPTDRPRVLALVAAAFGRADEAALLDQLRAAGHLVLALVAEFEGEIVGHIAFCRAEAEIDGRQVKALALTPLAVAPERQGRGVGSVLVASGLEAARTAGFDAVFAAEGASYYERFGFSADAAAPFDSQAGGALAAIELAPGALSGARGTLRHEMALRRLT